ncbi:hypothetical protein DL93DRAFT_2090463 [Clavulina sp. PMI_390]|nr:hypothetical protein DL93DRAFT_2090463 [Clavulina sp. PMI_390]
MQWANTSSGTTSMPPITVFRIQARTDRALWLDAIKPVDHVILERGLENDTLRAILPKGPFSLHLYTRPSLIHHLYRFGNNVGPSRRACIGSNVGIVPLFVAEVMAVLSILYAPEYTVDAHPAGSSFGGVVRVKSTNIRKILENILGLAGFESEGAAEEL